MNKVLLIFTLLFTLRVHAQIEVLEISEEELSILSSRGILSVFGEVTGIGGKIAISQVDSFVTQRNEVIPFKNAAIEIPKGKSPTTDNILSIKVGNVLIAREELLGVILK
jgi:hypothetical protein